MQIPNPLVRGLNMKTNCIVAVDGRNKVGSVGDTFVTGVTYKPDGLTVDKFTFGSRKRALKLATLTAQNIATQIASGFETHTNVVDTESGS